MVSETQPNPHQTKNEKRSETHHLVFSVKPKPKKKPMYAPQPISRPAVPVPLDCSAAAKTGETRTEISASARGSGQGSAWMGRRLRLSGFIRCLRTIYGCQ
jgi:hypothetical protein